MRRSSRRFLSVVLAATMVLGGLGIVNAAQASGEPEAIQHEFIAAVNEIRLYFGLPPYVWDPQIDAVADAWVAQMAAEHDVRHRPNLAAVAPRTWVRLGENVGRGTSVQAIMDALIASPTHFRNLVDPKLVHIGVGVEEVDGEIYVVQNFLTRGKPRIRRR